MSHPLTEHAPTETLRPDRPSLVLLPVETDARESLVHFLALDRLRDLHDDGLTPRSIARMYGVTAAELQRVEAELRDVPRPRCSDPERIYP